MNMKTQCEKIIDYMLRFGSISPVEAFVDLGIFRLASRIHDLRKRGYAIKSTMKTSLNRFGEPVCYKIYRLAEGETKNG